MLMNFLRCFTCGVGLVFFSFNAAISPEHEVTILHRVRRTRIPGLEHITYVNERYCDVCSRMRIDADGQLKTCLHISSELNLRDTMRKGASDAIITSLTNCSLLKRRAGRPGAATVLCASR